MNTEEMLAAINASGISVEQLTRLLAFGGQLVDRETLVAQIQKARTAQQVAHQASETEIQSLLAAKAALEAAMAEAVSLPEPVEATPEPMPEG